MHENKRLIKHATKVIDTVTFVVDSIGDPAKADQLNEALMNLVKSHLKRRIGYIEFYNLGLVIIDFICDLNNRRNYNSTKITTGNLRSAHSKLINSTGSSSGNSNNARSGSSACSSQDSETMTIALDKIRATSSPSSSSEDENILARGLSVHLKNGDQSDETQIDALRSNHRLLGKMHTPPTDDNDNEIGVRRSPTGLKLDPNSIVAAWKELYGIILGLVKSEEGQAQVNDYS